MALLLQEQLMDGIIKSDEKSENDQKTQNDPFSDLIPDLVELTNLDLSESVLTTECSDGLHNCIPDATCVQVK